MLNDNSITIDILTKSTYKLWEYTLNTKSITVTKHSTNDRLPLTVYEAVLTDEQSKKVEDFFSSINVDSLKEKYENDQIEGEGSYMFHFRINETRKKVYVYYEYPEELKKICDLFNSLLNVKYWITFK